MAVSRDEAIAKAEHFLRQQGCRVVDSLEGLAWSEDVRIVEFDDCHFVDLDRPHWSVCFTDQIPPGWLSIHPEGPIVTVDVDTGETSFFAAM